MLERGEHLNVYHFGKGEEITVRDVVNNVCRVLGREARIIEGPLPVGSPPRRCSGIAKLQSIGYEPKLSFTKGLPSLVHWYAQRNKPD